MPKFIDHHASLPPLPPEVTQQIAARIRAGQSDQFGVKGINVLIGADGQGWCLSEGPSAEAVVQSHAAIGFPLDLNDVVEITTVA
ncbi:MAG: hypothetical protein HY332_12525 [Chloroflexi bacterium]|nr:hypothetical protein [Chloroflexota bacterium]